MVFQNLEKDLTAQLERLNHLNANVPAELLERLSSVR